MPDEKIDYSGRVDGAFPGTVYVPLSLDPSEFKGMDVPNITKEILSVLKGIRPDADFFKEDVEITAETIVSINDGTFGQQS